MRVAIINELWEAGATRCARDLEAALRARGHVSAYFPEGPFGGSEEVLEAVAHFRPDIVHLHSYYGNLEYQFLSTISNLYPTCFTPHDPRPIGTMDPVCWDCNMARSCFRCPLVSRPRQFTLSNPYFWQRLRKRVVHSRCHAGLSLAFPSRWLQERFKKTELRRFRSTVIPNGIDLMTFQPIEGARARLGLDLASPVILHVAHATGGWHMNPRKGLPVLTEAFAKRILPRHPEATLIVVGEGLIPNHPRVRGVRSVLQEEIALYYSASDVFTCPSIADNLPYTILEAMGCGVPVVASDVGGVSEEVEDGVTGYVVPKGDEEALGAALNSLLDDAEKRHRMGQAGLRRAQQLFSRERFVGRYETFYRDIISGHRPDQNDC